MTQVDYHLHTSLLLNKKTEIESNVLESDSLFTIQSKLREIAKSQASESNPNCLHFLADVFGMALSLDDYLNPYKPLATFADGSTTFDINQIENESIESLLNEALKFSIKSPQWSAKLLDIHWVIYKNIESGKKAFLSYLDISELNSDSVYIGANSAVERAIQLFHQLNLDSEFRNNVIATINKKTAPEDVEPTDFSKFSWYELMVSVVEDGEVESLIAKFKTKIDVSKSQKNWRKARKYNRLVRGLYQRIDRKDDVDFCGQVEADLYVDEAQMMRMEGLPEMMLQDRYVKAIYALSNTKGRRQPRKQLLEELLEIQLEIPNQLKPIGDKQDITELVLGYKKEIDGKSFLESLDLLGQRASAQSKERSFENTKELMKDYPLGSLFGKALMDEKGKIISKISAVSQDDIAQSKIRANVADNMRFNFLISGSVIKAGVYVLNEKFFLRKKDLDELLRSNPFITEHRYHQYRDGIWSGLCQRWVEALYVLTPLLENSLRDLMQKFGYPTVKINADGTQEEKDLNSLIYSSEFETLFGSDTAFQLQVLLTDVNGINLRNNVAHGLVTDGMAYSQYSAFLWGQVVNLCFWLPRFYYNQINKKD